MIVILVFGLFILGAIAGLIYLATRFRRFIPSEKREKLGKWKSMGIGFIPVCALIVYCIFDLVNGVVVTVNVFSIWMICDFLGWLIHKVFDGKVTEVADKSEIKEGQPDTSDVKEQAISASADRVYIAGIIAVVFSVIYLGSGWYLAHHVVETDYTVTTTKNLGMDRLRIAQISDSHVGATFDGDGFAKHMEKVQEAEPDIVVITGDYVDDDTTKEDMIKCSEALGNMQTKYGVYYIFGNHDKGYYNSRDFSADDMCEELEKNGVKVLEDETVLIGDNIYLIGRQDRSEESRGGSRVDMETLTAELDDSKYQIVLDHQPHDFDAQAEAGVDLVLSGHTHGGQMIPVGITGELSGANDKTYGLEKRKNTTFIVNSGISDWAIRYKTGTIAEYGIIDVVEE